jgi:hypothetical protein
MLARIPAASPSRRNVVFSHRFVIDEKTCIAYDAGGHSDSSDELSSNPPYGKHGIRNTL